MPAPALVSVVMPVHNGGDYVRVAVDSILCQTHMHLELVIVDDHSSDSALGSVQQLDSRIRLIPSSGHGVVAAFNTGLEACHGDFVARMDADDIAHPERLTKQLTLLNEKPEIGIVGGQVEIFSAQGVAKGNAHYQRWLNSVLQPDEIRRALFIESPIPNPTAFFRRTVIDRLQGYCDTQWPEDYDLFLRADRCGIQMAKTDSVILRWRDHSERLTRSDLRYSIESFQRAKAHYLLNNRIDSNGILIWGAGRSGQMMHDLLKQEGAEIAGFVEVHPRRIGGTKRGLPVWGIEQAINWNRGMVLVAVGSRGARKKIRNYMLEHDQVEGDQFLFVA